MNIIVTGIIIFIIVFLFLTWFNKRNNKNICHKPRPFIFKAETAKKNNGNESKILFPIAKIIATNKDNITIVFLTPLAIFFVFWRANQDKNKNTAIKNNIERNIIFI